MMRYLSVLLLGLVFAWGSKIQVVKTTSQEWIGGLQETGYGTNYYLIIKVKAGSDQLQFDDLWVGDSHMKVRVVADPASPPGKVFAKGSRISLKAGITFRPGPDRQMRPAAADSTRKPFNFKGAGLLGYSYKGKKTYLEIAEFEILEKIIYP